MNLKHISTSEMLLGFNFLLTASKIKVLILTDRFQAEDIRNHLVKEHKMLYKPLNNSLTNGVGVTIQLAHSSETYMGKKYDVVFVLGDFSKSPLIKTDNLFKIVNN